MYHRLRPPEMTISGLDSSKSVTEWGIDSQYRRKRKGILVFSDCAAESLYLQFVTHSPEIEW